MKNWPHLSMNLILILFNINNQILPSYKTHNILVSWLFFGSLLSLSQKVKFFSCMWQWTNYSDLEMIWLYYFDI